MKLKRGRMEVKVKNKSETEVDALETACDMRVVLLCDTLYKTHWSARGWEGEGSH